MTVSQAAVYSDSTDKNNLTKIAEINVPKIKSNQMLVKAVAFAANPTDYKHRLSGLGGYAGAVVGSDVSGIVVERGSDVQNFSVGDFVAATLRGNVKKDNGAFSQYVVVDEQLALNIDKTKFRFDEKPLSEGDHPSSNLNTFEAAASVPLGLATVTLSYSHHFKLDLLAAKKDNSERAILIWGGATATGILAIQLAKKLFKLRVFTTASKKNHEFLTSLGADKVFDYKDSDVVEQIKKSANGSIRYALDTVSSKETFQQTYDATDGSEHVDIDNLLFLAEKDINITHKRDVTFHYTLMYTADGQDHYGENGTLLAKSSPELYKDFRDLWQNLLPSIFPEIKTAKLKVLPQGLKSANKALELLIDGKESGEKIVFRY